MLTEAAIVPLRRKTARDALLLLAAALLPALVTAGFHPHRPAWGWTRPEVEQVELDDAVRWGRTALWIDARDAASFRQLHVPGAILLNEDTWQDLIPGFLEHWKPGVRVVIYCDTEKCHASEEVAARLKRELQIPEIYVLKGGWSAWLRAPHP